MKDDARESIIAANLLAPQSQQTNIFLNIFHWNESSPLINSDVSRSYAIFIHLENSRVEVERFRQGCPNCPNCPIHKWRNSPSQRLWTTQKDCWRSCYLWERRSLPKKCLNKKHFLFFIGWEGWVVPVWAGVKSGQVDCFKQCSSKGGGSPFCPTFRVLPAKIFTYKITKFQLS